MSLFPESEITLLCPISWQPIKLMAKNNETRAWVVTNCDCLVTYADCPWIHIHTVVLVIPALFSISALHSELFPETGLWSGWGRWGSVCPDAQTLWLRGLYHTDREQHSSPALPSFTATGGWMWQPMLPSCSGARSAKPQADNECHTIVTTCTFMEKGRKDISGTDARSVRWNILHKPDNQSEGSEASVESVTRTSTDL